MFFLNRTLDRWHKADVISADQVLSIKEFEKNRHSGRFQKSLFGLGAFAILVGILAIVAANWHGIPVSVKLSVHMIVNAVIAYYIYRSDKQGRETLREILVLVLMGLTITFIGLTGQVFHLASNIQAAIILWMVLVSPFMLLFGRTKISLLPWLLGFLAAIYCGFGEITEALNLSKEQTLLSAIGLTLFMPLSMVCAGSMIKSSEKSALPDLLLHAGFLIFLVTITGMTMIWYDDHNERLRFLGVNGHQFIVLTMMIASAIAAKFIPLSARDFSAYEASVMRYLWMIGLGIAALPVILITQSSTFMAAISFVAFWLCVGGAAQIIGWPRLVTLAIFLVAVRIYVVYIELFGSLLQTGFGLILSGGVLIGLGYGAKKLHKSIDKFVEGR